MNWLVRRDVLDVARGGVLMGIVNVTPDSFSDGGRFLCDGTRCLPCKRA